MWHILSINPKKLLELRSRLLKFYDLIINYNFISVQSKSLEKQK